MHTLYLSLASSLFFSLPLFHIFSLIVLFFSLSFSYRFSDCLIHSHSSLHPQPPYPNMSSNKVSDDAASHTSSKRPSDRTVVSVRSNGSSSFVVSEPPQPPTRRYERPTEEEDKVLRRVSGKVPWSSYSIAFVELCERFSYYGTAAVCKGFSLSQVLC